MIIVVVVALLGRGWGWADASFAQADTNGVTIAVTGDIYTRGAKAVSDAILAHPSVAAVLLAGDTDNGRPVPLSSYQKLYQDSYGRFLSKIHPAPGNHDRYSKPPFSAYGAFWGASAHCPEMYYSFDLGDWHLLSLDSVTFAKGGKAATNQLHWVKADLAANPGKPVLAYWHYPLFSRAKHRGNRAMKPLWEAIYAHGPALLITGHNHVYERYGPLDSNGHPVSENRGIQEFVVSPGGATPVTREASLPRGPAPAKFHGGTDHVGFFTLFPEGGYTYTIESVAKSGATAIVDAGSGNLRGDSEPSRPRRIPNR